MPTKKATPKEKYYNSQGQVISREQWLKNDKDLEKSITGYKGYKSAYQMQKEQDAEEASQEASRKKAETDAFFRKTTPMAKDNTRAVINTKGIKLKSGGAVGKSKKPKMAMGGTALKPVDSKKNPGLSKLATPVRNKMGYKKSGGPVKKKMGGSCGTPKSLRKGK
jgi:hypothetical protein